MPRRPPNITLDSNTKCTKRILKPAVEKRRRDRINQSLAELRGLLLKNTCDVRLQNPKIEKAEILDVTVEYLQKWTAKSSDGCDSSVQIKDQHVPVLNLAHATDSMASLALFSVQNAGFQRCVAQLASYSNKLSPPQRTRLIQELKTYMESQSLASARPSDLCSARTNKDPEMTDTRLSGVAAALSVEKAEDVSSNFPFLPHHHQHHHQPSPYYHHDYISPPASPLDGYYCSTPAYATSALVPCHFSFPPSSLSPLSPNTSLCSSNSSSSLSHSADIRTTSSAPVGFSPLHSPLHSQTPIFQFPSRTTNLRPLIPSSNSSSSSPREEGVPANSHPRMWQPWS